MRELTASWQTTVAVADGGKGQEHTSLDTLSPGTPCYLLKLPAELRNRIYDLAFTDRGQTIELFSAAPPSRALLRTCRQIYEEAASIYTAALLDPGFWSGKHFHATTITSTWIIRRPHTANTKRMT